MDIQRSKLVETLVIIDFRFGNRCISMVFMTIEESTYFIRKEQKGNTTQGHWHNINLCSQMFSHVERNM